MDRSKVMRAAGNLYLADTLAITMEQLRPHSEKHRKMVTRMQKDLIEIRNAEFAFADATITTSTHPGCES